MRRPNSYIQRRSGKQLRRCSHRSNLLIQSTLTLKTCCPQQKRNWLNSSAKPSSTNFTAELYTRWTPVNGGKPKTCWDRSRRWNRFSSKLRNCYPRLRMKSGNPGKNRSAKIRSIPCTNRRTDCCAPRNGARHWKRLKKSASWMSNLMTPNKLLNKHRKK